ncbi:MAG TPA: FMN-binding protein [Jatrophihabitans sp.]|nr:FMN-binding protein [Jatrophihabitans sp.]
MRRVILAVAGTIAGLVALLSFKTHSPVATGALPSAGLPVAGTRSSTPPSSTPASSAAAGPAPARSSSAAPKPPASAANSPAATTKDYTGQAVQTQYGVVQVKVTMKGSTITNVSFVQLTAYDQRSQYINSQAGPMLLQQTLSAQSAQIDGVSGATYTTEGYLQSLQSALDQVGH